MREQGRGSNRGSVYSAQSIQHNSGDTCRKLKKLVRLKLPRKMHPEVYKVAWDNNSSVLEAKCGFFSLKLRPLVTLYCVMSF